MKLLQYEFMQRSITALVLSALGAYLFFCLPAWCFSLLIFVALIYTLFVEMPRLIPYKGILFWLITLLYPIMPFCMLIFLNQYPHYRLLVFVAILAVCANDIGAYCSGKMWGKHKIYPAISPKKTWEGFLGGLLLTFIALLIFTILMHNTLHIFSLISMALMFSIVGTTGDFFESWLKRKAHVKDSGTLLPGHGGLLDRFDSLLFVILLVFFYKEWLAKKLL